VRRNASGIIPEFRKRQEKRPISLYAPKRPAGSERPPKSPVASLKRFFPDSPPPYVTNAHWNAIQSICNSAAIAAEMSEFLAVIKEYLPTHAPPLNESAIFAIRFLTKMILLAPQVVVAFDPSDLFSWVVPMLMKFPNCTTLHREIRMLLKIALPQPPVGEPLARVIAPFCFNQVKRAYDAIGRAPVAPDQARPKAPDQEKPVANARRPEAGELALRAAAFAFLKRIEKEAGRVKRLSHRKDLEARINMNDPVLKEWYLLHRMEFRKWYGGHEIKLDPEGRPVQ
jgi:hypothetical protein